MPDNPDGKQTFFLSSVGIGWIATGEPIVSQATVKASCSG